MLGMVRGDGARADALEELAQLGVTHAAPDAPRAGVGRAARFAQAGHDEVAEGEAERVDVDEQGNPVEEGP